MYTQDNNTLPVWIILSSAYHHISINSRPFLVGIVQINKSHCSTPKLTSQIKALFNEMPSPEVIDLTLSDNEIQPDPIRSDQGNSTPTLQTRSDLNKL